MGSQGLCSVTVDGNKILIITGQAAKPFWSFLVLGCFFFAARVFLVEISVFLEITGHLLVMYM